MDAPSSVTAPPCHLPPGGRHFLFYIIFKISFFSRLMMRFSKREM